MRLSPFLFVTALICISSNLLAQHSDIEFGYDDANSPSSFTLSPLSFDATTADGIILADSSFRELDPFSPGDFSADQPGFATNSAAGLMVNPSDNIMLNVLDAEVESDFGVGYVNFFNPATDALEASGRISLVDNTSSTANLVLEGASIESGVNPQFIGAGGAAGVVHDHIKLDLLDDSDAPLGAYGILVQLQSDFAPTDGTIDLSSQPFWLVFNHGMSAADFESLVLPEFGVGAVVNPVLYGDANLDGEVTFLDIAPFVATLSSNSFLEEADCNQDGVVNFLDIAFFVAILASA